MDKEELQKHRDDNYKYALKSCKITYQLAKELSDSTNLSLDQAILIVIADRLKYLTNI